MEADSRGVISHDVRSGTRPDRNLALELVRVTEAAALAAALRGWLTDAALRERLRSAARVRRTTLEDWSVTVDRLSRVLAGVAA